MALKDLFKKKIKELIVGKKKEEIKEEKPILEKEPKRHRKKTAALYGVVKRPHISEKATDLGTVDRYVFRVFPRANKEEIKKTIESLYGVDVLAVNIITVPAKKRRLGKTTGFKKGYKKAIVKIKKGQRIEII